ncbi:MAG: ATP-binding cassette domain-containing protein [Planctomycetes bacterium]|nr:ATP-binding cassette domain-containing protein [Planctomycetota bacterium]
MSLELLSISRRCGDQQVLDSVSIHVRAGDCYGLIGHNGAGKTSALRVALGLTRPDSGAVHVDGFDARAHPREARARLGALIETPGFHGHLDARANLALLARLQGFAPAAAGSETERVLGLVGLGEVGYKRVRDFSQGMRQRLGIAQALLGSPAHVLLDEPTNGLDPEGTAEVRALLARLVRIDGVSVLISSHRLDEVAGLCNRIGVMRQGKLVVEAETSALLALSPARLVLATDDDARAARVLAELGVRTTPLAAGGLALELGSRSPGEVARCVVGAGLELARLGADVPALEEIYLRYARGERGLTQTPAATSTGSAGKPRHRSPPRPLARVLRYELARTFAGWKMPALLASPALVAAASIALERGRATAEAARVARGELASTTALTGFSSVASALGTSLPLLALIGAGLASQAIAGELGRGTLRNVLLRPATRAEVVLGKFLAGTAATLGAYLVLLLVVLSASAAAFGFGDLVEILPNGQEFPLVSAAELRPELVRALLAPLPALLAFFALGFLAGSCTRSATGGLGLAIGALFGLDLARAAARGLGFEGWLLSAYLPSPLGDTSYTAYFADRAQGISNAVFEYGSSWAGVPRDCAYPLLWAALCIGLSVLLLGRRSVP